MPTLKQALETLRQTRVTAETETAGDYKTWSGREMMRREAQRQLPEVRKKYLEEFRKVAFPVFVRGAGVKEFQALAAAETPVVNSDYQEATSEVKTMVRGSISPKTREFTPHHFSILLRGCRQLAADLGMDSIPKPDFEQIEVVPTDADADAVVDRYLLKYLGEDFLAALIEKQVLTAAEALDTDAPVVPVLITGVPESIIDAVGPRILCRKFLSIEAEAGVNTESVVGVLKKINAAMRKKKSEQQ